MSDSVWPHRRQLTRLLRPWDSPGKNTGVSCHFLLQCIKVKSESEVAQSCPTLSDPMDCSLPGSSVHGIFQARVLEWVALNTWEVLKMIIESMDNYLVEFFPLNFLFPCSMWHLSSLTSYLMHALGALSLNRWTTRVVLSYGIFKVPSSVPFYYSDLKMEAFRLWDYGFF